MLPAQVPGDSGRFYFNFTSVLEPIPTVSPRTSVFADDTETAVYLRTRGLGVSDRTVWTVESIGNGTEFFFILFDPSSRCRA